MITHKLYKSLGWVLVSNNQVCRIQSVSGGHGGALRLYIGSAPPTCAEPPAVGISVPTDRAYLSAADSDCPYFELPQGETFIKTSSALSVYAYSPHTTQHSPLVITVSADVDAVSSGGGGGSTGGTTNGLTDTQLRATAVLTTAAPSVYHPTFTRSSASGTTASCERVTISNTGTEDGTVLTTVLKAGESIAFDAPPSSTLEPIPYDATNTVFVIATLTKI